MKTRRILQFIAIIALLIWGGMFILFYVSGRIERYVDVSFRTWALIAGLGLCVLALFNLATFRQKTGCTHDHDEEDGTCCGHDHGHEHDHSHEQTTSGLVTAILVLTVPLLMAARFSENRFSSTYIDKWGKIERQIFQMRLAKEREQRKLEARLAGDPAVAAANREAAAKGSGTPGSPEASGPANVTSADAPPTGEPGSAPDVTASDDSGGDEWGEFTMEDLKRMVPQNDAGSFLLDVPQIFYTAGDDELMKVMEGIPIETTAQVMEETSHNPEGNRLRLFRLFIECCAADARPLSIPIEFPEKPGDYEDMGWVIVTGKMHFSEENGEILPIILVDSMEATAEPMDMMMY